MITIRRVERRSFKTKIYKPRWGTSYVGELKYFLKIFNPEITLDLWSLEHLWRYCKPIVYYQQVGKPEASAHHLHLTINPRIIRATISIPISDNYPISLKRLSILQKSICGMLSPVGSLQLSPSSQWHPFGPQTGPKVAPLPKAKLPTSLSFLLAFDLRRRTLIWPRKVGSNSVTRKALSINPLLNRRADRVEEIFTFCADKRRAGKRAQSIRMARCMNGCRQELRVNLSNSKGTGIEVSQELS